MRTVSKSATFLATESVNSAPFKRGETEVQIFWQGIAQNSSSILRCTFLARRRAKLIANFSATMVTSLPSFSLSLSLSVSLSLSHRMYLTHNIGSASALPIIQLQLCALNSHKQTSSRTSALYQEEMKLGCGQLLLPTWNMYHHHYVRVTFEECTWTISRAQSAKRTADREHPHP